MLAPTEKEVEQTKKDKKKINLENYSLKQRNRLVRLMEDKIHRGLTTLGPGEVGCLNPLHVYTITADDIEPFGLKSGLEGETIEVRLKLVWVKRKSLNLYRS